MKKFLIPLLATTILIIIGGIFLRSNNQAPKPSSLPSGYEYFWGDGCPHCAKVEAFLATWDKADKVKIDKFEVWKNPINAQKMAQRAATCNVSQSDLGVPFLFTPDGKCIIGDTPIIDYFKNLKL